MITWVCILIELLVNCLIIYIRKKAILIITLLIAVVEVLNLNTLQLLRLVDELKSAGFMLILFNMN